jgi:MFS family permease
MLGFTVVWIGQLVSLLGTAMSNFALTIWAYEVTGQATALALVAFFFITPMVVMSPVAGAIVDRSNRKLMMMVSDLAAGITTVFVLLLHATGGLQIWHLYISAAVAGTFQTFQWPAYSAAVTMMLPKKQYARANGMMELAGSASHIFAPVLAGALLGVIGLAGILIVDIATFVVAVGALLMVHVPQPQTTEAGRKGKGSLWQESVYGFRYIFERPSLLGLQLVFLAINLIGTLALAVFAPMILARTGNDEIVFGSVQSAGAIGGVVGGVVMGAWGGPKRRVHGVLAGMSLASLLGEFLLGLGQGLFLWVVASFFMQFFIPIINGSNQAIWQAKVAPDVQGRVFATRRLIAWLVMPLSNLVAGPLADYVFEPAMMPEGGLASAFGWLVGTGPGAGMSLMFVFVGAFGALVALGGYTFRAIRDAEDILPDHDAGAALVAEALV